MKNDRYVQRWLSFYSDENGCNVHLSYLRQWLMWLHQQPGLEQATPSDLVEMQKKSGGDKQYYLLDLLQDYVKQRKATYSSNLGLYSGIKSFFKRSRAALPEDSFNIPQSRDPVKPKLTIDHVKLFASKANYGVAAFYLTLWMGLLDQERFQYFNTHYGGQLSEHLQSVGVDEPFLIEFPGRKKMRGRQRFYTFIGKDALTAWKTYFERERKYPQYSEAILLNEQEKTYNKVALAVKHLRFQEKLHLIMRKGGWNTGNRYGFNLHEFRDVARTLLHLEGRKDGLDLECVEFWMGHVTDPNQYDKFYMDKEYMLEQYRIAEKYLNIISGSSYHAGGVEAVIHSKDELMKLAKALEEYGFIIANK
ncbi:MAG: hypothetical protein JSV32_00385 [Dehalococcoidia bacterium]|nr:MAG: hypothetical protein JSV32_00385 [Dehalococcoidia bacterium]